MSAFSSRPLSVVIVVGQLSIGGTEGHVAALAPRLKARGLRVTVVTTSHVAQPHGERLRQAGVPVRPLASRRLTEPVRRVARLAEIMAEQRADLVHSLGDPAGLFSALATRRIGVPHVHAVRSHVLRRAVVRRAMRRCVCRSAAVVTANSEELLRSLAAVYRVEPHRIHLTPNAVDPGRFSGRPRGSDAQPTILVVARGHPSKGLATLARVLSIVAARGAGPGLRPRFELLGSGLAERARRWSGRLGGIDVVGHEPTLEIEPYFERADMLLLTSCSEGMPNVVLEAMAAARPVVATSVGGAAEVLRDGVTGYLRPVGDACGLAQAVLHLLANDRARRSMGRRARASMLASGSWERAVAAVLAAYRAARHPSSARRSPS